MRLQTRFLLLLFMGFVAPVVGQTNLETTIQTGHSEAVLCLAIDISGKYIATGSKDKSIILWDKQSGLQIRTFVGHEKSIRSIDFSPDGKFLLSSSNDGTAIVWNVLSGKSIFRTQPDKKVLTDARFIDEHTLLTAGYEDEAKVWDLNKKEVIARIEVNADQGTGYGVSITVSPDKKWIALGEDNRSVRLVNTQNWEMAEMLKPEAGWCGGCGTLTGFSSDSKKLLVVANKSNPYIYSLDAKTKTEFGFEINDPTAAAFLGSGNSVLIADKHAAYRTNTESPGKLDTLSSKVEINHAIALGDQEILAALDNNQASFLSFEKGKEVMAFSGILNEMEGTGIDYDPNSYWTSHIARYIRHKNPLLFMPDGKNYLKGKSGLKVKVWNIFTGSPSDELSGHEKAVISMSLSNDGKLLATGDADGKVKVWNLADRKKLLEIPAHLDPVFSLAFNPKYDQLITSSWDGTVKIWDLKSGTMLTRVDLKNTSAYQVRFTDDGLYFVVALLNNALQLWEPDTKSVIREFVGHSDIVSSIDLSKDGSLLLSGSWDGSIRLWDIKTGLMKSKIMTGPSAIHQVRFSQDQKYLIAAGDSRNISFYQATNGKPVFSLNGHKSGITSFDQSADGKQLLSYSLDGVIKLWNLKDHEMLFDHIHIGADDWMVRNSEGYFSGTDGAIQKVHFVSGMQTFMADQFFDKFFRPDLLKNPGKFKKSTGFNPVEQMLKNEPLPVLKLATYAANNDREAILMLKLKNEGGGVENLKILHNGKRIPIKPFPIPDQKGGETIYTDTIKLISGKNIFSASAHNRDGVETMKVHNEIFSKSSEKSSTCHIMVVGLNKYKNPALNLGFARADAEGFAQQLAEKGAGLFQKIVVHALYDENADKSNILDTLDKLTEQVNLHDVFIFFYAGHGSYLNDQFYLIPNQCTRAYDESALTKTAISAEQLQQKFQKIKALKQVVIMDACHSGGSVEMLASRGALEERAIAQLARSAGIHILASSGEEQTSKEVKELEHGIFTYVLLKGMSGAADGSPADGKITVYELKSYIDDQVPMLNEKYSGKAQYPHTFSRGQDFPVCLEE